MGEHQAEDASSPVAVEILARATTIGAVAGQAHLDPAAIPAQAIIESEPFDWWTSGRRVRIGRSVAAAASANRVTLPADRSLLLANLPVPYDALNGTGPDGRALWLRAHQTRPGRILVRRARPAARRAGRPVGPRRAELHRRRCPPAARRS